MRYAALVLVSTAILAGCHRNAGDRTAYMRGFTTALATRPERPLLTASPEPTIAPSYVALEYGRPGQPMLTEKEASELRAVIREVKPCQRSLLRYDLASDGPWGDRLYVFFRIVAEGVGFTGSHVFGSHNEVYTYTGAVIPMMSETSDKQAIENEKCD